MATVVCPPTVPLEETADVETSSESYARRFSGAVGQYFLEKQSEIALRLLKPWSGARVLDVGGGHAQIAPLLAARGHRITVAGSRETCRERLDRVLPAGSFEFRACNLLRLPFPDRSFDVVIAFRLLGHVRHWRSLIAELCRVADRAVLVDYSDRRSFNALYTPLFPWKKALERDTRSFLTFRSREIASECARHGFGGGKAVRQFFVPMVLHRALGNSLGTSSPSRAVEALSARVGLTRTLGSPVILRVQREG